MREESPVVQDRPSGTRFAFDGPTRVRQAGGLVLCALLGLGGIGGSLACRRSSAPTPETPPVTAARTEPAAGSSEEPAAETAPGPAPSVDPLTQLRWQALTKNDDSANPAPTEGAPSSGAAGAGAGSSAPMHSERAGLRDYWQERVDEARGTYENARSTHRQECPELPPPQKRAPEDKSYCDDLERAERLAKDLYETARSGAARAGFALQ